MNFKTTATAILAALTLAGCNSGPDLNEMSGGEQTRYIAGCAALVLVTSSIAEAQGQMPEARQLFAASQKLVQAATGYIDITGVTEMTLEYVKDRREDVVAGRLTFSEVGLQADQCVKTVQKAGLV